MVTEKPELLPTHTHEPLGPVPTWHRVAKGSVVLVSLSCVFFGLGIVTRRKIPTVTEVSGTSVSLATNGFKKSADEVLLYKRTHPSAHPAKECYFLENMIGMSCSYAGTTPLNGTDDEYCAHRAQGTNGIFSYHQIKDNFYPQGDAEEWIKKFNSEHEKTFKSKAASWGQFMSLNTAFYTRYLDSHFMRWKEAGLDFKAHIYTNLKDGEDMLVLMTFNPATGNVIEIHGNGLEDSNLMSHFTALPDDACHLAVQTGHPLEHLEHTMDVFNEFGETDQTYSGNAGLDFAFMVKVSHPTMDAVKVQQWMADNAQVDLVVETSDGCTVARGEIGKWAEPGRATIQFVQASTGDTLVKEFIEHVENVHALRLGEQRGWDRWLDSHIGLVYRKAFLDDMAPTLVQNGVRFKAFKDIYASDSFCEAAKIENDCGSIWSEGVSGLGIEMHSFFNPDYPFFNGDFQPTYMDFCNFDTNKGLYSMDDDEIEGYFTEIHERAE